MADYSYKGYIAQVYEDMIAESHAGPLVKVTLISDFWSGKSLALEPDEARTMRFLYLKHFERAVDKHNERLK